MLFKMLLTNTLSFCIVVIVPFIKSAAAGAGAAGAGVAVVVFVVNMTGKNEIPLFVVLLAFESKRTERLLKWFFDELFISFSPASFTSDTCIYIFFTYMYERDETSASVPPRG
ncbi:hypothetical protein EDC94DRAFT_648205 [Helicostylum pulchrum]|nr:hypothetical protein EDC94DRAFT_648205 [Helicostylum pulchrum]